MILHGHYKNGSVLVLALLVSAVLAIMTASIMLIAKQHIGAATNLSSISEQNMQAESCAESLLADMLQVDSNGQLLDMDSTPNGIHRLMLDSNLLEVTSIAGGGCEVTIEEAAGPKHGSDISLSTHYGSSSKAGKIYQYKLLSRPSGSAEPLEIHLELRR